MFKQKASFSFTFFLINLIIIITANKTVFAQYDTLKVSTLEEVVISGNKFEQLKKESPQQIEIISKKDIYFQNAPNTAALLEQSGKVFVQKSQAGGGSPVIRGFEASRVLLVIDGVRINNAIFRAGHLQNVLRIDQNLLERVEIVMGPNSVIYGSDALGGVVHFQTKQPKYNTESANAYIRYSSAIDEKTFHADVNFGTKTYAMLTSLSFSSFGDVTMGKKFNKDYPDFGIRNNYAIRLNNNDFVANNPFKYNQVPSSYNQTDLLHKIIFKTGKVNHTLQAQASLSSNVPRYDRLSELQASGIPRFAEWNYGPENRYLVSYALELAKNSLFDKGKVLAAFQNVQESRVSRRFGNTSRKSQLEKVKVYSMNGDFQKNLNNNVLQYGFEAITNQVNSTANFLNISNADALPSPADTRYPDGGSNTFATSIYVSDNIKYSKKVLINTGLRLNYATLKSVFENKDFFPFPFNEAKQSNLALTGNVGIVYNPHKNTRLSGNISSGYRTPNVDDLGKVFESAAGTLIVPNPNIKPEYTYNAEIGLYQSVGNNFEIEAQAYYTLVKSILVVGDFTLNGLDKITYQGKESKIVALQNRNSGTIKGVHASVKYKFTPNLKFESNINLISGKLKGGIPLDHISPAFGRTAIKYFKNKIEAEFFVNYNARKRIKDYSPNGEDNAQYATPDGTPAWYTLNFRSSYRLAKFLTAQVALENILDQNYRTFSSGISAPGRNIMTTLRVNL